MNITTTILVILALMDAIVGFYLYKRGSVQKSFKIVGASMIFSAVIMIILAIALKFQ